VANHDEDEAVVGGIARMAELVMSEQTVQSVLDRVLELTQTTIANADAVGITLRRNDHLLTVAATVPVVAMFDDVQTKRGGGPGLQATHDATTIVVENLAQDERWPHFARTALSEGFKSVLAIPLVPVAAPIGALVIYSSSVIHVDDVTQMHATLLARQAAIAIANSGSFVHSEESNDQLREALASRDIIGQAKGILMERSDLTPDEAFDEMRADSQRENRKLRDIAEEIVSKVRNRGERT
jgi:GAF domain-containing protein